MKIRTICFFTVLLNLNISSATTTTHHHYIKESERKENNNKITLLSKRNITDESSYHGENTLPSWDGDACASIYPSDVICSGLAQRYHEEYVLDGDIMLAGLFPIHQGSGCSVLEDMGSIQRMEAMAYGVKMFNTWSSFMKNFTLGFRIYDTCNSQSASLSRTLSVLPNCQNCTHYPICLPECPIKVSGIVGPESSSNTLLAAHAANLALTPVISHFATSLELTDPAVFPTLFTTVPSDDHQVSAMLDLLQHFGWTYFSIVHTDDRYGKDALNYLQNEIMDMCLAAIIQVSNTGSDISYNKAVDKLLEYKYQSDTNVVIVFTDGNSANKLFKAIERAEAIGEFVWIGSEGWGVSLNDISSMLHIAQGAVTFTPHTEINPGFDQYFQELPLNHTENPWWKEIWKRHFNCSWDLNATSHSCFEYSHINESNGYIPDSTVSLVTDAVATFAYTISDYVNNTEDNLLYDEEGKVRVPPWKLVDIIRKKLISVGKQVARYDISNLQFNNGSYDYINVGSWSSNGSAESERLILNENAIQWPGFKDTTPISYCSEFCSAGEAQVLLKISCCWDCQKCSDGAIVVNNTRCQMCDDFYWPNTNFTKCQELELQYLKWNDPDTIALTVFASIVLILAVLTSCCLIWHRHVRLVKASGKELMSVIMLGVVIQASMVFFILAKPQSSTCFVYRFIFGLDLTISYSAIVVKSNRIYRIFNKGLKSPTPPLWIKTYQQLLTVMVMILFQIAIVTSLCVIYPPQVSKIIPSPGVAEITCSIKNHVTLLLPLAYNLLLILPCIYYSFKTRSLPANFNESRFIAFTVCTTLIIWVAFIPIYLTVGTSENTSSFLHMKILSIVEILSSFNTLACLFFPKIYALMCIPNKSFNATSWYKKNSNIPVRCINCGHNTMKPTGTRPPVVVPLPRRSMSVIARGDVVNIAKTRRRMSSGRAVTTVNSEPVVDTYPHQILINDRSNGVQLRPQSLSVPDLQLVELPPIEPPVKRSRTDFFRRSKRDKKKSTETNLKDVSTFELNGTQAPDPPVSTKLRKRLSINPIDHVNKWVNSLELPHIESPHLSPKLNLRSKGRVRLEPLAFDNEGNHHPNQPPGSPIIKLSRELTKPGILKEKTKDKIKNGIRKEKTDTMLEGHATMKEKTNEKQFSKSNEQIYKNTIKAEARKSVSETRHGKEEGTLDTKREGSYLNVPREESFNEAPRARVVTYTMTSYRN